jgi:pyruvate, orthophosphate dikinase
LKNIKKVEQATGLFFGDSKNPLLFSVRSGSPVSMPGMMDTVLNLGLNDSTIQGLIKQTGNERFAYDSYRRFVQMYANVVMNIDGSIFEEALEEVKKKKKVKDDIDLDKEDLKKLVTIFKEIVKKETRKDFPNDVHTQLQGAIDAVFSSWMNERAIIYRQLNNISDDLCTAVNIQSMVFGNMGEDSATGVAFTKNPSTGENILYGEYLVNAQGEDVVAGIRTPMPISKSQKINNSEISLEELMPENYKELHEIQAKLENHYKDMQDIEFTIQKNRLFILQTRTGKRSGRAMVKIAMDYFNDGKIDEKELLGRINADKLNELLHPSIDLNQKINILATGLPASPGVATGKIVFSSSKAEEQAKNKEKVILVRSETSPEDIKGMVASEGILTMKGGMTSHAAVVARGMGKCCVSGCNAIHIDYKEGSMKVAGTKYYEGDIITLDGNNGNVILGEVKTIEGKIDENFQKILEIADKYRTINIRTNSDTPHDTLIARKFGAEGIGLCRTEHMFFAGERIQAMREMIVAENIEDRKKALAKLLPMQKEDFLGIFKEMAGFPVTVRLLDPPLHEFLPDKEEDIIKLAKEVNITTQKLKEHIENLREVNPMLGLRGCRLGVMHPEITEMQVQAILEAAIAAKKQGIKVLPEIMVPLVSHVNELKKQRQVIEKVARKVFQEKKTRIKFMIGTMIELPRAALTANLIAKEADFFSFGTNDLTQTTFGLSRDDSNKFLPTYIEQKTFCNDPFITLDKGGVLRLISIAIHDGREVKEDLKIGICGEHGGDPESIKLVYAKGVNYVSCSPFRVPIARVSAAKAAIEFNK